jgi:hypothetical protein
MSYVVVNWGARVEGGPHNKLSKAKREALRFFRHHFDPMHETRTGWQETRDGQHSLWADDGSTVSHTGIVIRETTIKERT